MSAELIKAIETLTESIDKLEESNRNLYGIQQAIYDNLLSMPETLSPLENKIAALTKVMDNRD